jgi:glycerol-3-phosphate dehydrogenase
VPSIKTDGMVAAGVYEDAQTHDSRLVLATVTTPLEGGRASFAVPWEGMLLLGTTDTDYEGDPAAVRAEPEDIDEILSEASRSLPTEVLARDRIRYAFAGLRVLARSETSAAKTPREEVIRVGPAGMVSVAGGKLTTHRQIALKVLQQLEPFRRARLTSSPLPGAGPLPPRPAEVPPDVWKHLTHLSGDEAPLVLHTGRLERLHPEGTDVWGQVIHAVQQEWAITVDDVVSAAHDARDSRPGHPRSQGGNRPDDGQHQQDAGCRMSSGLYGVNER